MASSYSRVPQNEAGGGSSDASESQAMLRSRGERIQDKCFAAFWIVTAYLVAKWSHFYSILWGTKAMEDGTDIQRTLFHISLLGFGIVITLLLYLTVYLPKVKGLSDSSAWQVYCPRVIPTMGVVGLVSYLLFLRCLWPVWGFLAPLVSGFQVMAFLMSTQWIPTLGMC